MSVFTTMLPLLALLLSIHFEPLYAHDTDCTSPSSFSKTKERVAVDDPDDVQPSLIDSLLDWVELNTQYDVSQTMSDPPVVDFCKVGELIEYEDRQVIVDTHLNAAYDSQRRRINIVGQWSPDNIRDQSILLHELVHDVQLQNREWYCLQQPEWEAYQLQDAWLQEQGVDSGFDWLYIYFLSRCPRDHHP